MTEGALDDRGAQDDRGALDDRGAALDDRDYQSFAHLLYWVVD